MNGTPDNKLGTHKRDAVFLDRDGTLIEDRGEIQDSSQVVFFAETIEALQLLNEHFQLFIVTNQCGVAKGLLTMEDVNRINAHVADTIASAGVVITDVYCCPHAREDNCECIKPKPYFLEKAAQDYHLDLEASFVVGDHPHDVETACSVGATGIYVLSGHGHKHKRELSYKPPIVPGIKEAADEILRQIHAPSPAHAKKAARHRAADEYSRI